MLTTPTGEIERNKFTSFIFYKEIGMSITGIKIASFYGDTKKSNRVLTIELINFIKQELSRHDKIVWKASKSNIKAIRQYDAFLEEKKFIYEIFPELDYIRKYGNEEKIKSPRRSMLIYRVTGKAV